MGCNQHFVIMTGVRVEEKDMSADWQENERLLPFIEGRPGSVLRIERGGDDSPYIYIGVEVARVKADSYDDISKELSISPPAYVAILIHEHTGMTFVSAQVRTWLFSHWY